MVKSEPQPSFAIMIMTNPQKPIGIYKELSYSQ